MLNALISDLAVVTGLALVAVGLYFLSMIVVTATRKHDDRVISGEVRRSRRARRQREP